MMEIKRWFRNRFVGPVVAVMLVANALIIQTYGAGCNDGCTGNTLCDGATVQCVYCDAGVGIDCSDYQAVEYKGNVTKRIAGNQTANSQGAVWCMKVWQCEHASTSYGFVCAGGSFCGGPFAAWCSICGRAATPSTSNATHYICVNCVEE